MRKIKNELNDIFESYTGRFFRRLRCRTQEQPAVGSGRADYLVTTPDGDQFYIDATAVTPVQFSKRRIAEEDVCKKLNSICNNLGLYWFTAVAEGELGQHLGRNKLSSIREWVDEVNNSKLDQASKTFTIDNIGRNASIGESTENWTITIHADRRSESMLGVPSLLLARFGRSGSVDSASPLIRAARSKVKQLKRVSGPLLLVMNDMADFPADRTDVSVALFGWEQATETGVSRITPPPGYPRKPSLWGGGENTTISAILLFQRWLPGTEAYAKLCLYENPQARHPIPAWVKRSLPCAEVDEKDGIQYLRWPADERLSTVLGVPGQPRPYEKTEQRLKESIEGIFRNHPNP